MAELYYYDILSKLVTHMEGIKDDDLCCHRLDYHTYQETMNFLVNSGYAIEILIDNKKGYKSKTDKYHTQHCWNNRCQKKQ